MSALINHVSAVNPGRAIYHAGGTGGVRRKAVRCWADENWQPLACVSFPKDCLRGLLDQAHGFAQGPPGMVGVLGLVEACQAFMGL
jgi:hypothetical protein